MPHLQVIPAEPADFPSLARIQRAAFAPTAIQRTIFGGVSEDAHVAHSVSRMAKVVAHPHKALFKAVLSREGEDHAIVGMAIWELPKPEGTPDEPAQPREWPEGTNVELAAGFFGRLGELAPKEPHYHLSVLVVDPSYQRTGAGKALLSWGCKKADEEGLLVHLEATDLGLPLYRRYGFEEYREPFTGGKNGALELYPMIRKPLSLAPCTLSDVPSLAPVYHAAFGPTRVNRYCFPNVTAEAMDAWLCPRFSNILKRRDEQGERTEILLAKRGDAVLGFALSAFSPAFDGTAQEQTKRTFPEGAELDRAQAFMAKLDAHKAAIKEAHWSLDILAVLPEAQGQGVGKALVLRVLERAKEDGIPASLESTEFGIALYEKLGFARSAAPLFADDLPEVEQLWPMVYELPEQP
ncbi:hypothetical protein JCM10213_007029 [Rhodosporidiobolus nylandii]